MKNIVTTLAMTVVASVALVACDNDKAAIESQNEATQEALDQQKDAVNEAVSVNALNRLDDLDGIVTQKELVRTRRDAPENSDRPIFSFGDNASVSVVVTTTDSGSRPGDSVMDSAIDVTPSESVDDPSGSSNIR